MKYKRIIKRSMVLSKVTRPINMRIIRFGGKSWIQLIPANGTNLPAGCIEQSKTSRRLARPVA
jgi:hypothetical protein